jgi:hypothetical protein
MIDATTVEGLRNLVDEYVEAQPEPVFIAFAISNYKEDEGKVFSRAMLAWNKPADVALKSPVGDRIIGSTVSCCERFMMATCGAPPVKSYPEIFERATQTDRMEARIEFLENALHQSELFWERYNHDQRMHGNEDTSMVYAGSKCPDFAAWKVEGKSKSKSKSD